MYHLLILDDEPVVRTGIKNSLDYDSLTIDTVYEAENGQVALEIAKKHRIDLVLADINMPKMNGLAFSKEVKQINPSVRIAIITGYDYFDYAIEALRVNVDEYLLKPVTKNDIEQALKKLITLIESSNVANEVTHINTEYTMDIQPEQNYNDQINAIIKEKLSDSSFSLSLLAETLGLSSGYLSRLFKQYYGIPFRDYVLQERMNHAKILLLSSSKKIYEICADIGFDDPNYFSATFKKATGYSPNGYKKHVKNNG
jgi:two-component system response regulator YesN